MGKFTREMPQEDAATNQVHEAIVKRPGVTMRDLVDQKLSAAALAIELLLREGLIRSEVKVEQGDIVKRYYPVPMVRTG